MKNLNEKFDIEFMSYDINLADTLPNSAKVGILTLAHNRPKYVKKFLDTLGKSELQDALIVLLDDSSTDSETVALLNNFKHSSVAVINVLAECDKEETHHRTRIAKNIGNMSQWLYERFNCKFIVTVDSDMIVKRNWLPKLLELHDKYKEEGKPILITGFNSFTHRILAKQKNAYEKATMGGANMLFETEYLKQFNLIDTSKFYDWDWHIVKFVKENDGKLYCTKPSFTQHIGYEGANAAGFFRTDIALDFTMKQRIIPLKYKLSIILTCIKLLKLTTKCLLVIHTIKNKIIGK